MKLLILVLGVLFTLPVRAEDRAQRVSALIATADTVEIRGEMVKDSKGTVIRDENWIRHVSEALSKASLAGSDSCLCSGWETAYFYKNGALLVSIAAIHGNQLRIYSSCASGDFPISEGSWKAVHAALEIPKAEAARAP